MNKHRFISQGSGLIVKRLPEYWALYRSGARCCAVVGFYEQNRLVLTSYIHLN